jgi:hypothetical protein
LAILVQTQQRSSHHGFYDVLDERFGRNGRKVNVPPIYLDGTLTDLPPSIRTVSNRYLNPQHNADNQSKFSGISILIMHLPHFLH